MLDLLRTIPKETLIDEMNDWHEKKQKKYWDSFFNEKID